MQLANFLRKRQIKTLEMQLIQLEVLQLMVFQRLPEQDKQLEILNLFQKMTAWILMATAFPIGKM
ncbi:hypothetical protein D3C86_1292580 [compost metagenome]